MWSVWRPVCHTVWIIFQLILMVPHMRSWLWLGNSVWFILWPRQCQCALRWMISWRACRQFTNAVSPIRAVTIFSLKKLNASFIDEDGVGFRYLAEANNTCEWMWTIYYRYITASLSSFVTTSLLSIFHCYSTQGHFDADHFYRPAKFMYVIDVRSWKPIDSSKFDEIRYLVCFSLPWDQTTYSGYLDISLKFVLPL